MLCVYVFVVFLSISLVVFPHCANRQWGRQTVNAVGGGIINYSVSMSILFGITAIHSAAAITDTVKNISTVSAGPSSAQIITDATSGTVGLIYIIVGRS